MSEPIQNEQNTDAQAELTEETLENVAGGIIDGGCIPQFPGGCILLPTEPTICF